MKRVNKGTEKNGRKKKHIKKEDTYLETYTGPFEDLFEANNLFSKHSCQNDASWTNTLYFDCKAKRSIKCKDRKEKIDNGNVIDLVLHCKSWESDNRSQIFAFSKHLCESDKKMWKEIKRIRRLIKEDPGSVGEELMDDLICDYHSSLFYFNFDEPREEFSDDDDEKEIAQ